MFSTLQDIFLFFCKKISCHKVLIPAVFPFTGVSSAQMLNLATGSPSDISALNLSYDQKGV